MYSLKIQWSSSSRLQDLPFSKVVKSENFVPKVNLGTRNFTKLEETMKIVSIF